MVKNIEEWWRTTFSRLSECLCRIIEAISMFRYINWPTSVVVGVVMSSKSVLGGKIRPVTPVLFITTIR